MTAGWPTRCISSPSRRPTRITTARARKKTSSDGLPDWSAANALALESPKDAATDTQITYRLMRPILDPGPKVPDRRFRCRSVWQAAAAEIGLLGQIRRALACGRKAGTDALPDRT